MVRCVDFKDTLQKGFKSSKDICLYNIFDWLSVSSRYTELMFSLCCIWNRGLLCGILSKELHLDGGMLAGCRLVLGWL